MFQPETGIPDYAHDKNLIFNFKLIPPKLGQEVKKMNKWLPS